MTLDSRRSLLVREHPLQDAAWHVFIQLSVILEAGFERGAKITPFVSRTSIAFKRNGGADPPPNHPLPPFRSEQTRGPAKIPALPAHSGLLYSPGSSLAGLAFPNL
jgi:hypothetical protein